MASRLIPTVSSAETWRQVYQQFQNINFTAFDYNAIKQSTLDYVKIYFPETFNDFIESSEFIAWMELFAYVGELMAYRVDLNAHENLLPVAQRAGNVLRLAKFISYTASRNIPARGFVKMTSIQTTEVVIDGKGNNLTNTNIVWNDPTNPDWKEQFILVLNRALNGNFGTVSPNDRVQVQDVLFELYTFNNNPLPNGVIPYTVSVSNAGYDFELVPTTLTSNGPIEKRPTNNSAFTVLYANDGLGDGSSTTGFLMFTKQGSLVEITQTFDGVTPNQTFDLGADNINETDLWLNQINPNTGEIIDDGTIPDFPSGEWIQVDVASAQNIIFNTNRVRNKYETETLENDDVRLIFGDGEFANIPSGTFNIWYRISANADVIVPQNSISSVTQSLSYQDSNGNNQTLGFKYSLTTSIQNASPSEDLEHIRRTAPGVYYTQSRMVNGQDYNTFMLQDPSILKLRAINRTFAGESNYINFNDPSQAYDNVKIFGDDFAVFYNNQDIVLPSLSPALSGTFIIENVIQPLLSNPSVYTIRVQRGDSNPGRKLFTTAEIDELSYALGDTTPTHPIPLPSVAFPVYLVHDAATDTWTAMDSSTYTPIPFGAYYFIIANPNPGVTQWQVTHASSTLFGGSEVTKFWFANATPVVSFSTLNPSNDFVSVLTANVNADRNGVLQHNLNLIVTGLAEYLNTGLDNIHRLKIVPSDQNNTGFPTDVLLTPLLNPSIDVDDPNVSPASYTINVDGRASANGPTGLLAPTAGYTILNVGGTITANSSTNIPADSTSYNFAIEIDQVPAVNTLPIINGVQSLNRFYVSPDITSNLSVYRKFEVTDSTSNDAVYTIQNFRYVLGTSGFQIVNIGSAQILSNITGLVNNIAATSGSQIITFSVPKTASDSTGLANASTVYTANVILNGATVINLAVTGSNAQIFSTLLGVIQGQLGNLATIEQVGGNIQITNAATGSISTVAIIDTGANLLFASLTGVNIPGLWTTVPGTDTVLTLYSANITFDGGAPIPITISGGSSQTYNDLINTLNGFTSPQGLASITNGNLQVSSASVGTTSTVLLTDVASSGYQDIDVGGAITGPSLTGLVATAGFQDAVFFPVIPSPATLLIGPLSAPGSWDFTANIDGAGPTIYTITGPFIDYAAVIAAMSAALAPNAVASFEVPGYIRVTSASFGVASTVALTDAGVNPLLFGVGLAAEATPWTSFAIAVPGTDTTYLATIAIDGIGIPISIDASLAQTYTELIAELNTDLGLAATAAIVGGNVRITSSSLGSTSTVAIIPAILGGLFFNPDLVDFVALLSSVPGINPLFGSLDTFIAFNTPIIGTNTLGTEITTFETIPSGIFDGDLNYHNAVNRISFTTDGNQIQTYASLIDVLNANLQNLAVAQISNGNIKITSNTTGFLSKTNVTNYLASNGIIQALATALNQSIDFIYSGDTEGVDEQLSMDVTVAGLLSTVTFRMSEAQTYQNFANTILSQIPVTPLVQITFPSGNMKLTSTIPGSFNIVAVDSFANTFEITNDLTDFFVPGRQFTVSGAGANNGSYVTLSSIFAIDTFVSVALVGAPAGAGGTINPYFTIDVDFTPYGTWDIDYLGHNPTNDVAVTGSGTLINTATPLIVPVPISYIQGRGDVTVTGDLGFTITFNNILPYSNSNTIQNAVAITNFNGNNSATVVVTDYVYFFQADPETETVPIPPTLDNIQAFIDDTSSTNTDTGDVYSRLPGRSGLNFFWTHKTRGRNLIDPSATNIIDTYIIQRDYYINFKNWLAGVVPNQPAAPTPFDLRTDYGYLLESRMLSDTIVLQSGGFKVLFGPHAEPSLQATIVVIPSPLTSLTGNEIKQNIIQTTQEFFDITNFEFGESFYFSELAAAIHAVMPSDINSVVLVPAASNNSFGDLYQVQVSDNEIFVPDITVNQISIVTSLSKAVLRQS